MKTATQASLLRVLFGACPPMGFTEKTTDKEIIINIPWEGRDIDKMNSAARVYPKLDGTFTSPFGNGYRVGYSHADRMAYHFPIA